jgi:hypothetical protein
MDQLLLGDQSQLLEASVEYTEEKLLKSIDSYMELRYRNTEHERSLRMNDTWHPVQWMDSYWSLNTGCMKHSLNNKNM